SLRRLMGARLNGLPARLRGQRGGGVTGSHDGLKSHCPKGRAGSNPARRTSPAPDEVAEPEVRRDSGGRRRGASVRSEGVDTEPERSSTEAFEDAIDALVGAGSPPRTPLPEEHQPEPEAPATIPARPRARLEPWVIAGRGVLAAAALSALAAAPSAGSAAL